MTYRLQYLRLTGHYDFMIEMLADYVTLSNSIDERERDRILAAQHDGDGWLPVDAEDLLAKARALVARA